ncbi:MAG: hypothetical protein B6D36_00425 [Planctomycetes bacterium UTPLA1]|nr:MAG: hypothetical protein B6D36_00425 [Planctomycetes bacterium UTPLA1]
MSLASSDELCGPRHPGPAERTPRVLRLNPPGQFRQGGSVICGRQMETAMPSDKLQRLAHLANQLAETIMTAAICAEQLRALVRVDFDGAPHRAHSGDGAAPLDSFGTNERPIVDQSTLSLSWAGKSCHLGCGILFRLADRLARRPNQYITTDQLLRDVWDGGLRSPDTIRSAVRHLRERLCDAGMQELAAAIQGHGGRYGLILNHDG